MDFRYITKRIYLLTLLLTAVISFGIRAEQWRLHPTYNGDVVRMIDTQKRLYLLGSNQIYYEDAVPYFTDNKDQCISLFSFEKSAGEMKWMRRGEPLSESMVAMAEYNSEKGYLLVAYANGNIDFLYDNGEVKNVPGFKLAGAQYATRVNGIGFNTKLNEAYLATDFGFIALDDVKHEVKRAHEFGRRFRNVAGLGNKILLADKSGLWIGDAKSQQFASFEKLPGFDDMNRLIALGPDRVLAWHGSSWNGFVKALWFEGDELKEETVTQNYINSIERSERGVLISGWFFVMNLDPDLKVLYYDKPEYDQGLMASSWNGSDVWVNLGRKGLAWQRVDEQARWTQMATDIKPNAASAFRSTSMGWHSRYGMVVRNHGLDMVFSSIASPNNDMICGYKWGAWTPMSAVFTNNEDQALTLMNPNGFAIDPRHPNIIYGGSALHGLLRLDMDNPSASFRIGRQGDGAAGSPNYIAVHPDATQYSLISPFSTPVFDAYGNMWCTWFDYDKFDNDQPNLTLMLWTGEDRDAITSAADYRPMKSCQKNGVTGSIRSKLVPLKSSNYRNYMLYYDGDYDGVISIIDTKGTIEIFNDDQWISIPITHLRETNSAVGFHQISYIYEDERQGLLWFCTDDGVYNCRISDLIRTSAGVNPVKVSRNDGTNFADYLLDGVLVTSIAEDPTGGKWFTTIGGGLVRTTADGMRVVKNYTTSNSDLPHDNVHVACYNPENRSIMVSTDNGLAELFLSNIKEESSSTDTTLKAYPNPVRPDYYGFVTIEGADEGALVKIVDSRGALVNELGVAEASDMEWNLADMNGKRVRAGVYHIISSGQGLPTRATKILIVD